MKIKFGITGKLLVWFLSIIVIFLGTILILYIHVEQIVKLSESSVNKNYAISSGTKKIMEALLSMEENKQKYLLLKKADYLTFYNEAQRDFEENLYQITDLARMGYDISDVWQEVLVKYQTKPGAVEVAAFLAATEKDPKTIDTFWISESVINGWIDKIASERLKNEFEIEHATREINKKGRQTAKYGLIGLAISGLVGLSGIVYLATSMIRPLQELMGGIRDISSNRQAPPLKVRSQDEFGELAQAFNEMSHRLLKEERMRSDFISMLSHEIRTPLTSIRESVNMIREEVMGPVNNRQEKFLGIASSEISRISELLSHLMQASRLEPGLLELKTAPIEMKPLISECTEIIRLAAEAKSITLHTETPARLPTIVGNRKQLQQAMLNYLSNAVKFSEQDSTIISGALHIKSKKQVSFFVKDSGPGILEEDQALLFNKYYRGKRERERLEGVGLGLSIVKNIIEAHYGTVWVESRVGEGSTFGFTLPEAS
jgi:signal transduction histidine kinase